MRMVQIESNKRCQPYFPDRAAHTRALRFLPNIVVAAGQILAEITASTRSAVQTLNASGTVSGGTFTVSIQGLDGATYTTDDLAYNISNANLKTALEELLADAGYAGATVVIGGGPLPTDATVTFGGTLANQPVPLMTAEDANITGGGTIVVDNTTSGRTKGLWGPYNDNGSDGLATAKAISEFGFRTDSKGFVFLGGAGGPGLPVVAPMTTAPAFFTGRFLVADLVGLDDNAVADLGRLESGANASDPDAVLAIF